MTQMLTREVLHDLYRHMEWADARVWASILAAGVDDERLKGLLVHVHVVQRAFLHVWTGREISDAVRQPQEFATLAGIRDWARPYYTDVEQVLAAADANRLAEVVHLPWSDTLARQLGRVPGRVTVGESAFQVTSHTTYHRGQINQRLRDLGGEPPLVDYIAWLWYERAAPAW